MLPSQVRAAIFTVALPSRNPSPIRPEASPMPTRDSSWCHEDQRLRPVRPQAFQHYPEQLVRRRESIAMSPGVQRCQLLTEGEVFQDEVLARTDRTENPAEEISEKHDHGQNLNETLRIKLVCQSFIFRVHEVLTRDNLTNWRRWFFVATNASTSASPCFVLVRRDSPAACARVLQVSPVLRRREIRDFGIQIKQQRIGWSGFPSELLPEQPPVLCNRFSSCPV